MMQCHAAFRVARFRRRDWIAAVLLAATPVPLARLGGSVKPRLASARHVYFLFASRVDVHAWCFYP
jgi:hypothetical protein